MKRFLSITVAVIAAAFSSCIKNDLSYPDAHVEIKTCSLDGAKNIEINYENHTIDVVLEETATIDAVKILEFTLVEKGTFINEFPKVLDLRKPYSFSMKVYEQEDWTISATQPIERYIRCENQVGDAALDAKRKEGFVYVTDSQNLKEVTINEMKLEATGSVVKYTKGYISENGQSVEKAENCKFPMTLDCTVTRIFAVEHNGSLIEWKITFIPKKAMSLIQDVDAWTYSADIKGITNEEGTPVFEYKASAEEQWQKFSEVKVEGQKVSASITGLSENTEYQVRLNCGADPSEPITFHTGKAEVIANLNFDDWSNDGKMPNAEGAPQIWDSANSSKMSTTTSPTTDAVNGKAARLESVSTFGMLAAGNIFTGDFVKISGLGAELTWGVPFTGRPSELRGHYKYAPKKINFAKEPYQDKMGQTDECQIMIFITDWDKPFTINTSKQIYVDTEKDKHIIAFGQLNSSETLDNYKEFSIKLEYRDTKRIPKYLVIAAASSRYGDYFTGAIGSVLHIDEFELIYK